MSQDKIYERGAIRGWLAAAMGIFFSCGQPESDALLITINNLPARVTQLSVQSTLNGKAAMATAVVSAPLDRFGVRFLPGTEGQLVMTIRATDSDGCVQGGAMITTTLTGQYTEQPVTFAVQSPRMCGNLPGCALGMICSYNPKPVTTNLFGLWASSPTDIWAVGDGGVALHYDGTGWTMVATPAMTYLNSVWGSSSKDLWAVGALGTIIHYNGQSWMSSNNSAIYDLSSVYGLSATDVWTVGSSSSATTPGEFWHWDGVLWTKVNSSIVGSLLSVWASSPTDVTASGVGGLLIHFDGATATSVTSGTINDLRTVWGSSSSLVFAAGGLGTVIRKTGTGWKPATVSGYAAALYGIVGDGTTVYGVGNANPSGDSIQGTAPFDAFAVRSSGNSADLTSVIIGTNGIGWVTGKAGYLGYFDTRP